MTAPGRLAAITLAAALALFILAVFATTPTATGQEPDPTPAPTPAPGGTDDPGGSKGEDDTEPRNYPGTPRNMNLTVSPTGVFQLSFTRGLNTDIHDFELHRATSSSGTYTEVASESTNTSPVNFGTQSRGYHYKVRGQGCLDDDCSVWIWSNVLEHQLSLAVSGVGVSSITSSSATVTVTLNRTPDSTTTVYMRYAPGLSGGTYVSRSVNTSRSTATFYLSGLTPDQLYRVQASLSSSYSSPASRTFTTDPVPLAVSGVGVSSITSSSATVTVTLNRTPDSTTTVYMRYAPGLSGGTYVSRSVNTSRSTATFYLSGLTPDQLYRAQASLSSSYSSPASRTFTTDPVPLAVSGVGVSSITSSSATVTVTLNRTPDSTTTVYMRYAPGLSGGTYVSRSVNTSRSTATFYLSGLTPDQLYRVQASLSSSYSSPASRTFTTDPVPLAVSGVGVSSISSSTATVTVTLNRTPDSTTTVRIRYAPGLSGGTYTPDSTTTSSRTATFFLTGLSADQLYRVQASLSSSYTVFRSTSFTTDPVPLAVSDVSVSASSISSSTATVTVTLNRTPDSTTTVRIRYAPGLSGGTYTPDSTTTSSRTATFFLTGLSADQLYRVQASLSSSYTVFRSTSFTTDPVPNQPPTVQVDTIDQNVNGGEAIGLLATTSDPEGQSLTYSWAASPNLGTFVNAAAEDTGWLAPAATSADQVITITLTVTDPQGASASDSVTITVALNQPPTVQVDTVDQNVNGGEAIGLLAATSDPEGQSLTYSWAASPNLGTFVNAAAEDTGWLAPAATSADQVITITLTVTDPQGASASDSVTITVVPNQPPTVQVDTIDQNVNGGEAIGLLATTSDPEGQSLTYSWAASPNLGTFVNAAAEDTGWLAPAATSADQVITITLTVTDPQGASASDSVTITVALNQPPTVQVDTVDQNVNGGEAIGLLAATSDPEGQSLTYSWAASPNLGTFVNAAAEDTGWLAPAATSADQVITITLTVTDPQGASASDSVTITVALNQPPTVQVDTVDQNVNGGEAIGLLAATSDPEGQSLTYSWAASPNLGTFVNAAAEDTGWLAPAATSADQVITITLTVTDPQGASASDSVTITVALNQPPTVQVDTVDQNVNGGEAIGLLATTSDPEGQSLTYSWAASPNLGTFVNAAAEDTGWLAPAATSADQVITITLTVTDPQGASASDSVTITVALNQPPTVQVDTVDQNVNGGEAIGLLATTSDPEGQSLTYSWAASPNLGTFVNAAAEDTGWTAPAATSADQVITITLTVTDPQGASASDSVTITVAPELAAATGLQVIPLPARKAKLTWQPSENATPQTVYTIEVAAPPLGEERSWTELRTPSGTKVEIPEAEIPEAEILLYVFLLEHESYSFRVFASDPGYPEKAHPAKWSR